jgi:hypothetical protein
MGLDYEADRRTRSRRLAQKRLWNEYRELIERRQTIACRLKQIDAVVRSLDSPEDSRGQPVEFMDGLASTVWRFAHNRASYITSSFPQHIASRSSADQ